MGVRRIVLGHRLEHRVQVALYAGGLALLTALAAGKVGSSDDASFQDDTK